MAMANGKKFSTGNHPVEMTLPILQSLSTGFEIYIITPTGAPSRYMWAMPDKDPYVTGMLHTFEMAFKTSKSLTHFADKP